MLKKVVAVKDLRVKTKNNKWRNCKKVAFLQYCVMDQTQIPHFKSNQEFVRFILGISHIESISFQANRHQHNERDTEHMKNASFNMKSPGDETELVRPTPQMIWR